MRKFTFDPTKATSGTVNVQVPAGRMKMKFMNHSPANLTLSFPNGDTAALVSLTQREFSLALNSPNINWSVDSYAGSITPGLSLVVVEAYELREDFVRVSGLPAAAAPNENLFVTHATAGNSATVTPGVVTGQLFHVTRFEYYCDLGSIAEKTFVNLTNGAFLGQQAAALGYPIFHTTTSTVVFQYNLPTPYVQNAAGVSISVVATADASTPEQYLFVWGYYV